MKTILPTPTEHQLQTQIINYLRVKGWHAMRLNSGAIRATNRYGKQHTVRMSPAGTPDVMAFKKILMPATPVHLIMIAHTRLVFLEIKRPGNKPTPLQRAKMEELTEYGAECYVIHSIDELEEVGV